MVDRERNPVKATSPLNRQNVLENPLGSIPGIQATQFPNTFAQQRGTIPGFDTPGGPVGTTNITPNVGAGADEVAPNFEGLDLQLQANQKLTDAQMNMIASQIAQQQAAFGLQQGGIGLAREELLANQATAERDIGQGREAGLESANFQAQQRGIFNSGIRTENRELVERESAEALADLKQQTQFGLRGLAQRSAALRQQMAAARSGFEAQREQVSQQAATASTGMMLQFALDNNLDYESLLASLGQLRDSGQLPSRPSLGGGTRQL